MTPLGYLIAAVLTSAIFATTTKSHSSGVYIAGAIWPLAWLLVVSTFSIALWRHMTEKPR